MKNACIIGYGAIGPVHAAALKNTENVHLYGICDINHERADKGAKEHNCRVFYDFSKVLADENIDAVHICTPHYLHESMAIEAVEAGKEVILEKPVAISLEELNRLIKKTEGKKLCVMVQNRMNKAVQEFKRLIDTDKTLGKLLGGFASLTWCRTPEYYLHDEWRGKWDTEGGGVLINQAIHLIDLVSYLAGEIKSVTGTISNKTLFDTIEVEDTADAIFNLKNGAKVCYYATNGYSENLPMRLELQFENALLRYADNVLYRIEGDKIEIVERNSNKFSGKKYWGSCHEIVINDFYNGGNFPTLSDVKNSMTTLLKFYESAKNNSKETDI